MSSEFQSTKNKAKIRKIDLVHLDEYSKSLGRKLTYCGLPGKSCLDIKAWLTIIDRVTAFETKKLDYDMLVDNLNRLGVYKSSFLENIDDFMINKENHSHFEPYDIINLDYEGHLITADKKSKRLDAISELINIQREKDNTTFFLLITNKALRTKGERIERFLIEAKSLVDSQGSNAAEIFEWAREKGNQWDQLMIATPIIIMSYGLIRGFEIDCKAICFYKGKTNKSPMLHFIFKFEFSGCSTPLIGVERFKPIPLKQVKEIIDGEERIYQSNMPEFKEDIKCPRCEELVRFNSKFCDQCGFKIE